MTSRIANGIADQVRFAVRQLVPAVLVASALTPLAAAAGWQGTGPYGGAAELVRTVPKASGLVLAGAHNGLIYVSRNGGAYWSNIPFPGEFAGVLHALEIDPRSASTWYAGMESQNQWASGIYKTTDAGRSWTLLPQIRGIEVWSIAVWQQNPDVVAAGTSKGVYLSKDAGASWSHISSDEDTELKPVVSLSFHPSDSNTIFAGTTHLPWRTTDGGKSWKSIHQGMIDDSDVFSIQVDQMKPSRVFASACSGVYGSANGADLWSKLSLPGGAFRTYFVAIDPKHDEVVFAGTTEGLMRSADGGRAWRKVDAAPIKSIAFDPNVPGRVFFASTTAGMMVSTDDGNTLRETNYGFTNRNFTTLTGSGSEIYSSSVYEPVSGGVYRSDNLGLRWIHAGEPPAEQLLVMAAAPDNSKLLFAAGYQGLLESRDAGKTWTAYRTPPPGTKVTAILPESSTSLFVGTERGLFHTTDGATWDSLSTARVDSIAVSGSRTLLALTSGGALHSSDSGVTWTKCGDPQPTTVWFGLAFDPGVRDLALAATASGLFRSTDNCRSWSPVRDGVSAETSSLVLFHPSRSGDAFAVLGGQVFHSTNGGIRWVPLEGTDSGATGHSGPASLFVLPDAPDRLFALFPRRGVFSVPIPLRSSALARAEPRNADSHGLISPKPGNAAVATAETFNHAKAKRPDACCTDLNRNTTKEKTLQ